VGSGLTVTAARGAGTRSPVREWQVASTTDVTDGAEAVSSPGYDATRWLVAPARSTVMAALLAGGEYPDVFYSTRMRDEVDRARFAVPWWFRTEFLAEGGDRTHVQVQGVIPCAALWVNGRRVLDASTLAGAYVVQTVDVTDLVRPGANALALLVPPGNPLEDLSIGWVDWAQPPPDDNMGPWRDVVIERTGDVRLSPAHVRARFVPPPPDDPVAHLEVLVEVTNHGTNARTVSLDGSLVGHGTSLHFRRKVDVAPGATVPVRLGADDGDTLTVAEPAVWWPIGEGAQPLYRLSLDATVEGTLSDHVDARVGLRTVESEVMPGGGRQFVVNGRRIQILGAGWSPDLFLRSDPARTAAQLALSAHVGLNAIRPEGKLENPEFYDLCDELGIMVLPGWECCNKWEAWAGTGGAAWDDNDLDVAERSMESEAELLRSHASVICFLIGSDYAPPPPIAQRYVRALESKGWTLPVVASAAVQGSEVSGPSGMKMTGPYDWVPPVYWYDRDPQLGGAIGFNSETSAGHTVPRTASLRRMLTLEELDRLWQQPSLRQYHSAPAAVLEASSVFDQLGLFANALEQRYGRPRSAADFVAKSQLAAYEAARAQFEAYVTRADADEPATGVVYWMLTPPWPSLNWQLFDYDLDTPGSFAGARKALERLHVLYAYDTETVKVVNRTRATSSALDVTVRRWTPAGEGAPQGRHRVGPLEDRAVVDVAAVAPPDGVSGLWFLELELATPDGAVVSRNVYWLSTTRDVLDRHKVDWYAMGVSTYADFRALSDLRAAKVRVEATASRTSSDTDVEVTLRNDDASGTPAVGLHLSLAAGGHAVSPVFWDDNDIVLFSGQSVVVRGRTAAASEAPLLVHVEGFNLYRPLVAAVVPRPPGASASS
jgi:exo-1,4-beta-D-glucosaminidase